MNISQIIQTISVYAIPVLLAISLFQAAYGYAARYYGDPTAAEAGRLTANPLRHIDPIGTILLPVLLYVTIQVPFGYAKPLPVDFSRLRNPKKHMVFVAMAGPLANFAMGLGWMIIGVLLIALGINEKFFFEMVRAGVMVNAALFVFNLIPVPPLSGGRIVTGLLPMPLARHFAGIERYSLFVFIGLIVLMQMGIFGGFMIKSMQIVVETFGVLIRPLTFFLN